MGDRKKVDKGGILAAVTVAIMAIIIANVFISFPFLGSFGFYRIINE
ncbi:hypothetical protein [Jeotgalibacillus sp. JSM ZJ347]